MFQNINKKFDICSANFPQTPFPSCFKIDRCGFEEGNKFNLKFIKYINNFLNEKGQVFMLVINLSNIKIIDNLLRQF